MGLATSVRNEHRYGEQSSLSPFKFSISASLFPIFLLHSVDVFSSKGTDRKKFHFPLESLSGPFLGSGRIEKSPSDFSNVIQRAFSGGGLISSDPKEPAPLLMEEAKLDSTIQQQIDMIHKSITCRKAHESIILSSIGAVSKGNPDINQV